MTEHDEQPRPAAEIAAEADRVLLSRDLLAAQLRAVDIHLNALCREYCRAEGYFAGMTPDTFRTEVHKQMERST